jgi:histone H3
MSSAVALPVILIKSQTAKKKARGEPRKRKPQENFEIPKATFRRLVQEIADKCHSDLRFQSEAIEALQTASEGLLVQNFQKCSELAELCRMDTVRDKHWEFVNKTFGEEGA